ncbi:MAG TPA: hypothetical protein VFY29_21140 [Terriglobia bacterium]|nr:hypothetical protein [Terriglobia bacterium]
MEVRLFPNSGRPGVGLRPRRESQRPHLPQHSRHCPVLDAGSSLGYLVYPPLEPNESFHVEYEGEGRYRISYYFFVPPEKWEPIFAVTLSLPPGGVGMIKEDVEILSKKAPISREMALTIMRGFIVPEDMGTPAGGISLRGSVNFQTPEGWDTVYTPIFNMIERPIAPMLIVRVETDWFPHETEFRYVLQPGEGIAGSHSIPIGQVFFVPREEITMRDCTTGELEKIVEAKKHFAEHKAASKITTPYGLQYSPHYLKESRDRK